MAAPIRNVSDASAGMVGATPRRVLNRLAIRVTRTRGVVGRRRRRR